MRLGFAHIMHIQGVRRGGLGAMTAGELSGVLDGLYAVRGGLGAAWAGQAVL